jgi:hypothetical protein
LTVTLAEKPSDILVYLADHGPACVTEIEEGLGRPGADLQRGGLSLLVELLLITPRIDPMNKKVVYLTTDDGLELIRNARSKT